MSNSYSQFRQNHMPEPRPSSVAALRRALLACVAVSAFYAYSGIYSVDKDENVEYKNAAGKVVSLDEGTHFVDPLRRQGPVVRYQDLPIDSKFKTQTIDLTQQFDVAIKAKIKAPVDTEISLANSVKDDLAYTAMVALHEQIYEMKPEQLKKDFAKIAQKVCGDLSKIEYKLSPYGNVTPAISSCDISMKPYKHTKPLLP